MDNLEVVWCSYCMKTIWWDSWQLPCCDECKKANQQERKNNE